ncbi:hypothetical protein ALC60_11252, partial [Trachymyrmex zeteki]
PFTSDGGTGNIRSMPTLAAVPTAQAITVLASQIPAFDGSEDKDVESWIHLVDLIANAHGVAPYIIDKVLSSNRYVIKDIPDHNLSPGPYNSILSPDRIKAWARPETA